MLDVFDLLDVLLFLPDLSFLFYVLHEAHLVLHELVETPPLSGVPRLPCVYIGSKYAALDLLSGLKLSQCPELVVLLKEEVFHLGVKAYLGLLLREFVKRL